MERTFRQQLFFLVLCLSVLKGDSRYIEDNEISREDLYSFLNSELKRGLPEELIYHRPLRCLDMIAVEGQFTFTAERPQLNCAAFFIAEPDEVISVDFGSVDIDCQGGDFIKVFDGWVMKGEKFPSSQDHPLPVYERYVDYCSSGSLRAVRSSQNVAMVFFRIHNAGSSFTLTMKKLINPFPCNIISQTPEGSFTMVIPQQHRNCSFSIIYPVEIQISEFSLGHRSSFPKVIRRSLPSFHMIEILVELKSTNMKIGCDNTVVRMISSGKFVNRVSFSYQSLDPQELQRLKQNSVEDFCFND
uniref:Corticotropin-releasing factor-binding protein n=1 Tax=Myripristis murdjan TaxID=586833 RepID=A0A667X894_9TELE